MTSRGIESPMEFEWQSRHGPADVTSPFHQLAMENQRKRPYSIFDSPAKIAAPALREPNSQQFLFSQIPISKPIQSSYRTTSFTTPRKAIEVDFSSGPENYSSPEQADNEDTPDAPKTAPVTFTSNDGKPTNKRNSLFNFYGRFAPSPGRGEIPRTAYSNAVARRIYKKRRRAQNLEKQLILGPRNSDDTSEDEGTDHKQSTPSPPPEMSWIAGLFTFIERYPQAPSLIAKYLQIFFNAAILLGCLYALYSFWATIKSDVDLAGEHAAAELLAEMEACAKSFVENRCGGDNRLPALETVCSNWAVCMNRDPNAVKRARLSAHTFAEILNSFVEPISLKTMLFSILILVTSLVISNATFSLFRKSQDIQHPFPPPDFPRQTSGSSSYHMLPPTPGQQHVVQQYGGGGGGTIGGGPGGFGFRHGYGPQGQMGWQGGGGRDWIAHPQQPQPQQQQQQQHLEYEGSENPIVRREGGEGGGRGGTVRSARSKSPDKKSRMASR